ncbi:hypothetical protein J4410_07825 [Candidatus Woesearchaeota archaeon]|nr:hypothetical protein [Candidatus Woesearchaeota archaeon]
MNLKKDKKSSSVITDVLFWMAFAVAIGVVTSFILGVCGVNVKDATRIPENLEDEVMLAPRFYNSEKCFAYIGPFNIVHPKLIDASRFNQDTMDESCFPESEVSYSFKLRLEQDFEGIGPKLSFGPIKTHNWIDLGYESKRIVEKVLFLHSGAIYNGNLIIDVKNVE